MSAAVLDARQPEAPEAPVTLSELRSRFRDRKAELLEHFRVARPTAPAATRLIRSLCKHVDETLLTLPFFHASMSVESVSND